jgi:rhamnosyltransferase
MSSDAQISIIMLVKNEAETLLQSLTVIAEQAIDRPYEVLVIDSGSTDSSVDLIRERQRKSNAWRLIQIPPSDFHHARTRNLGVALTRADHVAFLGGDAVPVDRNWLRRLSEPLTTGAERIVAAYGRQLPKPDADPANICRMSFNYGSTSFIKGKDSTLSSKERYFFSSVNCCIDRGALPPPLFDESFPVNEDVTLATRIINRGMKIAYVAEAAVIHSHNYGLTDVLRRGFDNGVTYEKLGIFKSGDRTIKGDGLRYLRDARQRLKGRPLLDWFRFCSFFFCTAVGVQLGVRHRLLPKFAGKALSKYGTV